MGRGQKRGRTQRKHFKESREDTWKYKNGGDAKEGDLEPKGNNRDPSWEPFNTENQAFVEYYKEQGIVSEDEWDVFISFLRKPLPAAFRINSSAQFYKDIQWQLENDFSKSLECDNGHELESESIRPLPWYPRNLAWHSNFSRMQLRKNQALERFHEFLKLENETGNITRQEAVSMVPPLFLNVSPDHHILDMCAAPGSKTFQLLEMMHQTSEVGLLPNGLVIANDVDAQRCNLLIHQTKRMCNANLIVTNHEAQNFPSCKFHSEDEEVVNNQLQFDRVLCDVPCSGDGTLRKAPDIWRKWNSGMGNGLHRLQIQIAMRGLALLKVGGRMVYSTCSMNPVENEAVVAEILRRCGSSVDLLNVSGELPQLTHRQGLKHWKVKDKGIWLHSYEDVPSSRQGIILESMFSSNASLKEEKDSAIENELPVEFESSSPKVDAEANVNESLPLERCVRIVPHDQNSGAFFIAVLQKLAPLPVKTGNNVHQKKKPTKEKDQPEQEQVIKEASDVREKSETIKTKAQIQGKWRGVDPVVIFDDRDAINSIKLFYGIDDSFPLEGHLVTRNSDASHVKRIYYISKSVLDTVKLNFMANHALKITSLGLKIFERQTSKEAYASSTCAFRISSEGLPLLLPHLTKQIIYAPLKDFQNLLKYRNIKFSEFHDQNFGQQASELTAGCCVVILTQGDLTAEKARVDASTIAIGCWKGKTSISVMVSEVDSQQLLERISFKHGSCADIKSEMETGDEECKEENSDSVEQG